MLEADRYIEADVTTYRCLEITKPPTCTRRVKYAFSVKVSFHLYVLPTSSSYGLYMSIFRIHKKVCLLYT